MIMEDFGDYTQDLATRRELQALLIVDRVRQSFLLAGHLHVIAGAVETARFSTTAALVRPPCSQCNVRWPNISRKAAHEHEYPSTN